MKLLKRLGGRNAVIGVPYLWLLLFFMLPFVIVLRISVSEMEGVQFKDLLSLQDGVLQRSWCIIPGDPPGTYTYDVSIDGEPRGEFVFCAIEVPDQNPNTDPRDLNCPNKFNAVERERPRAGKAG